MRIAIGIPCGDMLHSSFSLSLATMMFHTGQQYRSLSLAIIDKRTSLIQRSRQEIVQDAYVLGADKLLFLDSDMTFPPDTLLRLLQLDKPIVGCNASRRSEGDDGTGVGMDGKPIAIDRDRGVIRVKSLGFAVMLIDMKVFAAEISKDNAIFKVRSKDGTWIGEDRDWCSRHEIWCDTTLSLEIGHVGTKTFFLDGGKGR